MPAARMGNGCSPGCSASLTGNTSLSVKQFTHWLVGGEQVMLRVGGKTKQLRPQRDAWAVLHVELG